MNPITQRKAANCHSVLALGTANAVVRLATNSPNTIMLALPQRSASPARSDEIIPKTLETTEMVR